MKFDLESAVNDASKEWESTYAAKLEKLLAKRPVNVKLDLSTKSLDNLDEVKRRLAEVKLEPVTAENQAAIKELVRELKELAKIMEKIEKFKGIEIPELQQAKAAKALKETAQADEKLALQQERARQSNERLILAQQRAERQAKGLNNAYNTQSSYLSRLVKRMAIYASFAQIGNFLTKVREVTAEFELQRVSLGAIIQDQNRANQLFSEIKSFALTSPVSILDLTKYTKQLAAYKIGVDDLFDTTKRLTDVSVGLGVSMDRVVLAYGQTRATGYLRASEIRQFTEMGVPIVEELASKLTKMNGELTSAADVMDMVSKRAISFDLVKEVFDDMTSAGGMFYKMQEKQGNTLFGLWAKLGDAASVMYDQIGNTESVNGGMKTAINLLTDLMRNWKAAANTVVWLGVPSAVIAGLVKYSVSAKRVAMAEAEAESAAFKRKMAVLQLSAAIEKGDVDDINAANATLQKAAADEVAAKKATTRTGLLKSGFASLAKSFMSGLGIGLVITAVTALVYKLFEAYENAHRLDRKLNELDAERLTLTTQSVRNFEHLAETAVRAADGSKKQKDALDELHRTYKNMIPEEDLTIENLRRLRAGAENASEAYKQLTTSIREYIAEQQKQKKLSAIQEEYGTTITKSTKALREELIKGFRRTRWHETFSMQDSEIERFFVELEKRASDTSLTINQKIRAAMEAAGVYLPRNYEGTIRSLGSWKGFTSSYVEDYLKATNEMASRTQAVHEAYSDFVGDLGRYGDEITRISNIVNEAMFQDGNGNILGETSYLGQQMKSNKWVTEWAESLKTNLTQAGVEVQTEWFNIIQSISEENAGQISSINFDGILQALGTDEAKARLGEHYEQLKNFVKLIQRQYNDLVPQNRTVAILRAKLNEIVRSTHLSMNDMQRYLMGADEDIETYAKRIKSSIEDLQKKIKEMRDANAAKAAMRPGSLLLNGYTEEEIKQANAMLLALQQMFSGISSFAGGNSSQSDPRLGVLQEMLSTLKNVNKEYEDLNNKVGETKAISQAQAKYASTFRYLQLLADKYHFDLPELAVPKDSNSLKRYYEAIKEAMKKLPKSEKAVLSIETDIADLDMNAMQKRVERQIEQLKNKIAQTKTAKEFYEKILGLTGDVELSAKVSVQLYGTDGRDLKEQTKELFKNTFGTLATDNADISGVIGEIIDRGAYEELAKYIAYLPKQQQQAASELVKNQQQLSTKQYEQWVKDLAKAKGFAEKRIELSRTTAIQIAAIEEKISTLNPQAEDYDQQKNALEQLIEGYKQKERKESANIEYDMFKDMPIYVQMFENLDNASKSMLANMLELLKKNKDAWGEFLTPTQLKEMQSRVEQIEEQLASRNPIKSLGGALKDLWNLRKGGSRDDADKAATDAMQAEAEAMSKWVAADKAYQDALKAHANDTENEVVKAAKAVADSAKQEYESAHKTSETAQEQADAWKLVKDAIDNANAAIDKHQQAINNALNEISATMEVFGADAIDLEFFNQMQNGFNQIVDGAQSAATAYGQFATGDYFGGAMSSVSAITSIASGISNLFTAGKVRKANKEIKRQKELLEQLDYTYSRLQASADKLFGGDYLNNYSQQLKNLQAQQTAYLKQAEAERSKGKKADEEAIKGYEEQAQSTADKIKEMQDDLVGHFTGSSKTDVARQMAQSWIDARASLSDTFAAIKGDYADLIKNMIVEGSAARVIENALNPLWESMEKNLSKGDTEGAIDALVNGMDDALTQANNGMETLWQALEARGYDMKQLISDTDSEGSGIAKNISNATSEEINTLTAVGNTLMYYVSPIPRIDENLAIIRSIIENGGSVVSASANSGWTDWQQQAMENYTAIARNTADTVIECRRAAEACEKLSKAVEVKGGKMVVRTSLN